MMPTITERFYCMKTIALGIAGLLIAGFSVAYAQDNDPLNALGTQTRNSIGTATEAPMENPALLGADRVPRGGLMLPPFTDISIGVWSDKLAISPFELFVPKDSGQQTSWLLEKLIYQSFSNSLIPNATTQAQALANSNTLTDKLAGGFTIYSGERVTLLDFAVNRFAVAVTTQDENQIHVPEGPLYALFSATKGLQQGNTLDFSNMRVDAMVTTDFTFDIGLPVMIPALNDFFNLRYGAGGLGVKYVMGHSMFHMESDNASVKLDPSNAEAEVNGSVTVQTAGTGLHGDWQFDNPFQNGMPQIAGHGLGIDLGGILYDDEGSLSINVRDLGVIFWLNQVRTVTYTAHTNGLNAWEVGNDIDSIGSNPRAITEMFRSTGGSISDSTDSLVTSNGFTTMLPLKLDIGYTRTWDLSKASVPYLASYATVCADYEQGFTQDPGSSYIPRLSIAGEAGTLYGYLPLRMGFVVGGPELLASALGASLNFKYFSIDAAYKAVGTLWFVPKNGLEIAGGMKFNWGVTPLASKYTVVQVAPPVVPPPAPVVVVEYDNDHDGIPDSLDQCPYLPGPKENDGCPYIDRDKDGIPDSLDKCPMAPENYNGYQDSDGCPDTIPKPPEVIRPPDTIKPTQQEIKVINTKMRGVNFKTASAELLPSHMPRLIMPSAS